MNKRSSKHTLSKDEELLVLRKEAQIEATMERIRARAMAMQTSTELPAVIELLYKEIARLKMIDDTVDLELCLVDETTMFMTTWSARSNFSMPDQMTSTVDLKKTPVLKKQFVEWKKCPASKRVTLDGGFESRGKEWQSLLTYMSSHPDWAEGIKIMYEHNITEWYFHHAYNRYGSVVVNGAQPINKSIVPLLRRFSREFERTYQRFLDLKKAEKQAREAQIEAALEKIRSHTNGMQESAQLAEVIKLVFDEAVLLGFGAKACDLVILDHETGTSDFWISGNIDIGNEVVHFKTPKLSNKHYLSGLEAWKAQRELRSSHLKGSACRSYLGKLSDAMEKWGAPAKVHTFIRTITEVHHTEAYIRYGYFRVASVRPLLNEEQKILQRFAKAFEQTYTRFLDLKKAEGQAREAKIEAALERVRASSMAMHQSDELTEVLTAIYEELSQFQLTSEFTDVDLQLLDENDVLKIWNSKANYSGTLNHQFSIKGLRPFEDKFRNWKKTDPLKRKELFQQFEWKGKEFRDFVKKAADLPEWKEIIASFKKSGITRWYSYCAYNRYGALTLDGAEAPDQRSADILRRFSAAFEQTYTRFLDLQKAEARAEEAQIEVALERIRARALAMQSSEELLEVTGVMREQMRLLDEPKLEASVIEFFDKSPDYFESWYSMRPSGKKGKIIDGIAQFYYKDSWVAREVLKAYQAPQSEYTLSFHGKKFASWIETFKIRAPDIYKSFGNNLPKQHVYTYADFTGGALVLVSEEEVSSKSKELLKRTSAAFDLAYKRFLDLQKAETQAREAEIELALERVRARTMAMQHSDELREVVAVLYKQLVPLGFASSGCELVLCDSENEELQFWSSTPQQSLLPECYSVPQKIHPFFKQVWKAWKKQTPRFVYSIKGVEKRKFDDLVFSKTSFKRFPAKVKKWIRAGSKDVFSLATMKYGLLEAIDNKPLSEDKFLILERFANVFEQTYTRFLDLQKAEAQAQEAEIELALERVRSRATAMQSSDELGEVATLLYKEFTKLVTTPFLNCGYVEVDEENNIQHAWMTNNEGRFLKRTQLSLKGDPITRKRYEAWKRKDPIFFQQVRDAKLQKHIKFVTPDLGSKGMIQVTKEFPNPTIFYCGNFSQGYLHLISGSLLTDEEKELLVRFTRVFKMTYSRFLDLKKAEAQAREAQIEAALERVRSRSLAMHDSMEMREVITTVFEQLKDLGFVVPACSLILYQEDDAAKHWLAGFADEVYPESYTIPFIDTPYFLCFLDDWRKGKEYGEYVMEGEAKVAYAKWLLTESEFKNLPKEFVKGSHMLEPIPMHFADAYNKYGMLEIIGGEPPTSEQIDVLKRFSKVFEQTYTRFLDLQKAESQGREAQIEAALERVRAQTMAMQQSEDIKDVVNKVLEELTSLDVVLQRVLIWVIEPEHKTFTWWSANPEAKEEAEHYRIPYKEHAVSRRYLKAWTKQPPVFNYTLKDAEKKSWEDFLFSSTEMKKMPRKVQNAMRAEGIIHTTSAINPYGLMMVGSLEPLGEKNTQIVQRFSDVFQQSYARFKDIQLAEAQAREAQIEAALERVRSSANAMHTPDDIIPVAMTFWEQLNGLNLADIEGCAIHVLAEYGLDVWYAFPELSDGDENLTLGKRKHTHLPSFIQTIIRKSKKSTNDIFLKFSQTQIEEFYRYISPEFDLLVKEFRKRKLDELYFMAVPFRNGFIGSHLFKPLPEESRRVIIRFTAAFDVAYRRFEDLQKAEAQAREAQIEAALERVRARTMAMHESTHVASAVRILFDELDNLGIDGNCGLNIIHEDYQMETWSASEGENGVAMSVGLIDMQHHPATKRLFEDWKKKEPTHISILKGIQVQKFFKGIYKQDRFDAINPRTSFPDRVYLNNVIIPEGSLWIIKQEELSPDNIRILSRFAGVFSLTYRRYRDLKQAEAQAREAQIEAALERVRSASLAMHESSELSKVATTVYRQLLSLGFDSVISGGFNFPDEKRNLTDCWFADSDHKDMLQDFTLPLRGDKIMDQRLEYRDKKIPFLEQVLEEKELKDHMEFVFPPEESTDEEYSSSRSMPIPTVFSIRFLIDGYMLLLSDAVLDEEQKSIFERFAKAFDQSYVRFLDLQKAERQAREALIEAAMERVRAHSLAMQSSEDLLPMAKYFLEELSALGQSIEGGLFGIGFIDSKQKSFSTWITSAKGSISASNFTMPMDSHPLMGDLFKAWKKANRSGKSDQILSRTMSPEGMLDWVEYLQLLKAQNDPRAHIGDELIPFARQLATFPQWTFVDAFFKQGVLIYQNVNPLPPSFESILIRFAKLFEQSYTRYLDLKRAEEQTREAEIELALERVRARTMAMHNSTELGETAFLLFEQMLALGVEPERFVIGIVNEEAKEFEFWGTEQGGNQINARFKGSIKEPTCIAKWHKAWKEKKPSHILKLSGRELKAWIKFLKEELLIPVNDELLQDTRVHSSGIFSKGLLIISTPNPLPDEHILLLERFAVVFDQTYTRFLDLEKAEAQAREAQIEASLERVRARSMAMHETSELNEVVHKFFEELRPLGFSKWGFRLNIAREDQSGFDIWLSSQAVMVMEQRYFVPSKGHWAIEKLWDIYKRQVKHLSFELQGKEKRAYEKFLFTQTEYKDFPATLKRKIRSQNRVHYTNTSMKHGVLTAIDLAEGNEESTRILMRFTSVFEQVYTRFLDLQRAEAQARDAQIEAALERVRSASAAMHESSELVNVATTVYQQLMSLGFDGVLSGGFNFPRDDKNVTECWYAEGTSEGMLNDDFAIPLKGDKVLDQRLEYRDNKIPFLEQVLDAKDVKNHMEFVFPPGDSSEQEDIARASMPIPTVFSIRFLLDGYLVLISGSPLDEDQKSIMARFASAFDQSYKRFLDLRKAETQAREAQIEAALERVRSASLAMHESKDLHKIVNVVLSEMKSLDISMSSALIHEYHDDSEDMYFWPATPVIMYPEIVHLPYIKNQFFTSFHRARKESVSFYTDFLSKKEKNRNWRHYFKHSPVPADRQKYLLSTPAVSQSTALFENTAMTMLRYEDLPFTDDENAVLKRFGQVFQQAYQRFLDLRKAEEQAKEAQIEASLERVRAASLAMHRSEDLNKVLATMFNELADQGMDLLRLVIWIYNEANHDVTWWAANPEAESGTDSFHIPWAEHEVYKLYWKNWEQRKKRNHYVLQDKVKESWDDYLFNHTDMARLPKPVKKAMINVNPVHLYNTNHDYGLLMLASGTEQDDDVWVIERYSQVFNQSYTRFLDLKKAEEQAREAQIEAALERVRSASMTMQTSDHLTDVAIVLHEELIKLDFTPFVDCGYVIVDESNEGQHGWMTSIEGGSQDMFYLPLKGDAIFRDRYYHWKKGVPVYSQKVGQKRLRKHIQLGMKHSGSEEVNELVRNHFPDPTHFHSGNFEYGYLHLISDSPLTTEEKSLMTRFTSTFEMSYKRFLDLKKAEEQAREAQIEAAMERIRSRALAMRTSEELMDVMIELRQQIDGLGQLDLEASVVHLYPSGEPIFESIAAVRPPGEKGEIVLANVTFPVDATPRIEYMISMYHSKDKEYTIEFDKQMAEEWQQVMVKHAPQIARRRVGFVKNRRLSPKPEYWNFSDFSEGSLLLVTHSPASDDTKEVLRKAANVFDLAYRRYQDLKRAEARAREAEIEASLERVRAKALAMHSSEDLTSTVNMICGELLNLNVDILRLGVMVMEDTKDGEIYGMRSTDDGEFIGFSLRYEGHPLLDGVFKHWKQQKEFAHVLKGKGKSDYYQNMSRQLGVDLSEDKKTHYAYAFMFAEGSLYTFSDRAYHEDEIEIFRKFNSVMGLTYRRYHELQQAEASEKEAIQQSSIDRVRAEIASMRTTNDLERITPLVWNELTTLGVPFFRCGVFIIDDAEQMVHAYLSNPSGESLAALEVAFGSMPLVVGAVKNWRKQWVYVEEWNKEQFIQWTRPFVEQGQITSSKDYQDGEDAPEHLVLQMVPFTQGMMYVGSAEALTQEQIELVKDLARAFSVAYARYEDFIQLEEAKSSVEATLAELKTMQSQLVQSEKMASLGELTAGIAHEIQNPLNFVNNFAEVSGDLIDELNEELAAGNAEDVKEISTDLLQNLQKIAHHGKRASSIVKGMLEHSRTGDGTKEPTDINALADEYLRLAYHGLRAKDKSFNADFEMDFDTSLPKVDVVPQDIGRVLLNLINNAFHAVSERAKKETGEYKPTVTVTTSMSPSSGGGKGEATVLITVSDNGPGIPDDIKEKIFQPFFTTKATGEGTGLGLSLSYDIVTKGHDGEIALRSENGEGTEFIIKLPVK